LGAGDLGLVSPIGLALQALGRWLHFAGYALGFGASIYCLFIAHDLRPLRLAGAGVALLLVAEPLALLAQTASLDPAQTFDADALTSALASPFGRVLGLRLAAALLLWAILGALRQAPWLRWSVPGLGLALALVDATAAHAIPALPQRLGLVLNAVHVFAMGTWVGGLAAFTIAPAGGFGRVATWSAALLVLSGVALAFLHFGQWRDLMSTAYGQGVIVKVPLVAVALYMARLGRGRWELAAAEIGAVTDTGELRCYFDGEEEGAIPAEALTDEAPRYEVEQRARPAAEPAPRPEGPSNAKALLDLLASPNVRSRAWIYRRYDQLVGSRTVRRPGLDAAVLRLRPSLRGIAVSLDASGRICKLDPRTGGAAAVLEAARNVACAGGEPLAITDCLNFGNPERPEIAWELAEAIEGIALACEALGIPVVSGNVSLYNETGGRPIHPTPAVGCVGLVPDVRAIPGTWREGDVVLVAGEPELALDGSEYQALYGELSGRPAPLDLEAEAALIAFLWRSASLLSLAHDAAEGGLAVACAEAAIASGIGAELELPSDPVSLFGEGGGQAVIACAPSDLEALHGVPLRQIGVAGGDKVGGVPLTKLRDSWEGV